MLFSPEQGMKTSLLKMNVGGSLAKRVEQQRAAQDAHGLLALVRFGHFQQGIRQAANKLCAYRPVRNLGHARS